MQRPARALILTLVAALIASAAFPIANVSAAVVSPVARWSFDETSGAVAHDAVAGRNGTIAGATSVADGAVGRALHFDGADRVTVPDAGIFRGTWMDVSFWVRADTDDPPE